MITKKILVVDDEPIVRDLCVQYLSSFGYQVDECASGEEALVAVADRSYDLLILDLCLKGMNGLATFRHVRSKCPDMKAIVVSGALSLYEIELQDARRNGVLGTLGKPFALCDLRNLVEAALLSSSRAA